MIVLNLSDQNTSVSIEYSLIVLDSNQPPDVSSASLIVDEDSYVDIALFANDSEGDELTYNIENQP